MVQQGLGVQEGQEGLGALEVPSLQGCPQLQPGQGSLGGPADLVGLSSPLGPGCQGLPWGQQAQEAPGHPLDHLEGAEGASGFLWFPAALGGLHPRGCPGQLGNPRAGRGPQGQLGSGALPAR